MKNLYYKIVNDVYYKIKEGPNPDLYRLGLILIMSFPMVVFFIALMAIIQRYTFVFYELSFLKSIIENEEIYDMLNGALLEILPFILINYYLILYKDNFKKYLDFNKYQKGKLIKWYYFILIFPVVLHLFSLLF
jgi:hypothetical protein